DTEIGRAGKDIGAQLGLASAVMGMAGLAILREQILPFPERRRIRMHAQRIGTVYRAVWHAVMQKIGGDFYLKRARFLPRAGKAGHERDISRDRHDQKHRDDCKNQRTAPHGKTLVWVWTQVKRAMSLRRRMARRHENAVGPRLSSLVRPN